MSCADSNTNQAGPVIVKIECEDEAPPIGKPCIDFQPDDRWQIKEEDSDEASSEQSHSDKHQDIGKSGKVENEQKHINKAVKVENVHLKDNKAVKIENAHLKTEKVENSHLKTEKVENEHLKTEKVENEHLKDVKTEKVENEKTKKAENTENEHSLSDEQKTLDFAVNGESAQEDSVKDRNLHNNNNNILSSAVKDSVLLHTSEKVNLPQLSNEANSEQTCSESNNDVLCSTEKCNIEILNNSVPESKPDLASEEKVNCCFKAKEISDAVDKESARQKDVSDDTINNVLQKKSSRSCSSELPEIKSNVAPCLEDNKAQSSEINNHEEKDIFADSKKTLPELSNDKTANTESISILSTSKLKKDDEESKDEFPPQLEDFSKTTSEIPFEQRTAGNMPILSSSENFAPEMLSVSKNENDLVTQAGKEDITETDQKDSATTEESQSDNAVKSLQISSISNDLKTSKLFQPGSSVSQRDVALGPENYILPKPLEGIVKPGEYKPVRFPHTGTLLLAENEVIIESPSLLVPLLIKEADIFPPKEQGNNQNKTEDPKKKQKNACSKNFFQSSVGKFLIGLGLSRVQEWYHRDMKRSKEKQLKRQQFQKKIFFDKELEEELQIHKRAYIEAKQANQMFSFRLRRCQFCDFKSESRAVMEAHYLIPHVTPRKEYRCNFCVFCTRDPKEILFHFEALHGKAATLDFVVQFHECPFCSFQSHLKTKANAHINRCQKHFVSTHNQAPPFDFEFPGVTTKPVTITDVLAHRSMLMNSAKAVSSRINQHVSSAVENTQHITGAKRKLASVLTRLSSQSSVSDLKSPTLLKQLTSAQTREVQQRINHAGIQLPPGIVITRPRASSAPIRNSPRFLQPRIISAVRHTTANTSRKVVPYLNNSAASQLASSGISITPVTKTSVVKVPTTNTATNQVMKNITLTPISSANSRVVSQKPGRPQPVALFTNLAGNDTPTVSRNGNRPGLVMTIQQQPARIPLPVSVRSPRVHIPYQRLNTPPSQVVKGSSGNTFVMCEICDSYIKDLEELRSHMNWVHKVKIHPKMLVSRPPLNCQKCQWRFFTDQGLERHLLGAHGLVTTNMQEMANKNQDGGRCIICGAVFTYKLVSHMTQVHKVTLKPAHLSYKCTVCTATFTLYRLFESHVYNVHSGSAKRPAEEAPVAEPPNKKTAVVVVQKEVEEDPLQKCQACGLEVESMEAHLVKKHLKKCSVKLCRIEKCEKCLYSSDEMVVIRMSDFGMDDDDDDDDDDEEESEEEVEMKDVSNNIQTPEDKSSEVP